MTKNPDFHMVQVLQKVYELCSIMLGKEGRHYARYGMVGIMRGKV